MLTYLSRIRPEGVIARELHKKHDLECKKQRLLNEITAETHLLPETPKILGVARVIPESAIKDELKTDEEIEKIGMNIAMSYKKSQGRMPEDVSSLNLGYDIRFTPYALQSSIHFSTNFTNISL